MPFLASDGMTLDFDPSSEEGLSSTVPPLIPDDMCMPARPCSDCCTAVFSKPMTNPSPKECKLAGGRMRR